MRVRSLSVSFAFAILGLAMLALSSCTTIKPPAPEPIIIPPSATERHTVTHTVAPGESFWRIGKMYDVAPIEIAKANDLDEDSVLRMGQKITVPRATKIKPVISLFKSKRWRYIVIHHSATEEGNSLAFNQMHLQKGWDKGVGYHFVIDNATGGKQDGQIEPTPRWLKQQEGAHCKASDMNTKSIGICLVGNFDEEKVTRKQMESLVHLVKTLQDYYRIPDKNIIRHGHVLGAKTHCPGKKFPWSEFKQKID